MLSWSNTVSNGTSRPIAAGNAYVAGNTIGSFLWLATAQDLTDNGSRGTVAQVAQRTATVCYMRGLKENIRIQTSSGLPWFHRRICFTSKGSEPFITRAPNDTGTPPNPVTPYLETTGGMQRLWLNQAVNASDNTLAGRYGVLFKGTAGIDWNDVLTAPVDTARVTLKFDKTWTIRSGNANGTVAERKLWHAMNSNLVYDEDETGVAQTSEFRSVESKAGMGDYYVLDILFPGEAGTTTDFISLSSTSSLYWHEK